VLPLVPNLSVGKPQNCEAGCHQDLISHSILCLLCCRPVVTQPIRLHDQLELGPEEVHPKATHSLLRLWRWETRSSNEPEETSLELRVGKSKCPPIEDSPKRWGTSQASVLVQCGAQGLRIRQPQLVRLVDGCLQLARVQERGEIEQGASRTRHRDPLMTGPIASPKIAAPVNSDPSPPVALVGWHGDIDHRRPILLPFNAGFHRTNHPKLGCALMTEDGVVTACQDRC
jgi:hypothetical protein